jgi:hypothetical protein
MVGSIVDAFPMALQPTNPAAGFEGVLVRYTVGSIVDAFPMALQTDQESF